jgi:hypothetical protein
MTGQCSNCNRIANVVLRCPCGRPFAYCGPCAQVVIRAAFAHTVDCDRAERALEPAPRALVAAGVLS